MVDETTDVCGWNIWLWAQATNYDGTQTLWYLKGKPIWSSIFLWFHVKFRTEYSRQSDCHTLYEVLDRSKNSKDPHFGGVDLWNVGLLSDRGIISFSRNNHGPDVAWWTGWSSWPNPGTAKPQNQNHQPTVGLLLFYTHDVLMIYTILVRCNAHFPTIDPQKIQNYPPAAPVATFLVAAGPLQHFDLPKCCAERTGKGRQARCSNTLRF